MEDDEAICAIPENETEAKNNLPVNSECEHPADDGPTNIIGENRGGDKNTKRDSANLNKMENACFNDGQATRMNNETTPSTLTKFRTSNTNKTMKTSKAAMISVSTNRKLIWRRQADNTSTPNNQHLISGKQTVVTYKQLDFC